MHKLYCCLFLAFAMATMATAQTANTDSIKSEMEKIELTNQSVKQNIEKMKKGVIKGDLESMDQLALELMSGKNVKTNIEMAIRLLDSAARQGNTNAKYDLGSYYFILWAQKPSTDAYFAQGTKWLKQAIKDSDNRATTMTARFYFEYGKYKKESSYVDGAIKLLESYPMVSEVNHKDDGVLAAQAWLGTINLAKWRMDSDTTAIRAAKKWYQTLLKSDIEFPTYTQYIDSLQAVLSSGASLRLDPMPDPNAKDDEAQQGGFPGMGGGFGGGFGGFGGGFPGMGGGAAPQGPQGPQATFPGGNWQMQQFISKNTYYPKSLQDAKVKGSATVSFTIDTDGAVINPTVSKNAEVFIMDKEALRTIMIMPDWEPAMQDDKPVQANHQATVNFGGGGGMGGMMMF